jgi:hypothetical protein
LNLSVNLSSIFFNIKLIWSTRCWWTHNQISSIVFESFKFCWIICKFKMPLFLLFFALLILSKCLE